MNSLKTVLIVALFGVLLYGAYELIYSKRGDRAATHDGGPAPDYEPPSASIPGAGAYTPKFPPPLGSTNPPLPGTYPVGQPLSPNTLQTAPAFPSTSGGAAIGGNLGNPTHPLDNRMAVTPGSAPGVFPRTDPAPAMGAATGFDAIMAGVQANLNRRELTEALGSLSALHGRPDLTPQQNQQTVALLDQLAGTVIYSQEHLLAGAYVIRQEDTIEQIAKQYRVPWELLVKINGLRDPRNLVPGQTLKVIPGPFDVVIHLGRHELTVMLGSLYAGRFQIGVGRDQAQMEGDYVVTGKMPDPPYYGPGETIGRGDPNNPYGNLWIGLADQPKQAAKISLHGTNDPSSVGRTDGRGSIRLGSRDIGDIYDILTLDESRVTVRR